MREGQINLTAGQRGEDVAEPSMRTGGSSGSIQEAKGRDLGLPPGRPRDDNDDEEDDEEED